MQTSCSHRYRRVQRHAARHTSRLRTKSLRRQTPCAKLVHAAPLTLSAVLLFFFTAGGLAATHLASTACACSTSASCDQPGLGPCSEGRARGRPAVDASPISERGGCLHCSVLTRALSGTRQTRTRAFGQHTRLQPLGACQELLVKHLFCARLSSV